MRIVVRSISFAVVLLLCSSIARAQISVTYAQDGEKLPADVFAASVRVTNDVGNARVQGSGTCVWTCGDHTLVLSCGHGWTSSGAFHVSADYPDRAAYEATLLARDTARDTSAFLISGTRPLVPVLDGDVTIGEPGSAVGYPHGEGPRAWFVTINRGRSGRYVGPWIGTSLTATHGHSGGGAFVKRDSEWRLAGITSTTETLADPASVRLCLDRAFEKLRDWSC